MLLLLDESLPHDLAFVIPEVDVRTVRQMGWESIGNGELVRRAEAAGFDVFLMADRNLEYQQNLSRVGVGILVLLARSNRLEHLRPLVPDILAALATVRPGTVSKVGPGVRG